MDGEVIIGASLNTKQLEKDLKSVQKNLEKSEKENKKLLEQKAKIEVEIEINEEEYRKKIDLLNQKFIKFYQI